MKRACITIFALMLCAGLSQAQTNVPSKNAVGYVKVGIPPSGGFNLVALNFRDVGGANITIQELFGTNQLTQGFIAPFADSVSFWDEANSIYQTFFQKTDGLFYNVTNAAVAVNPEILPGQPFWLGSPATAATTNEVYLMGEVVGALSADQIIQAGLNMLNGPYANDNAITNTPFLAQGATGGFIAPFADNIFIWNGAGYDSYFIKADGLWYNAVSGIQEDPVIPIGVGAWYDAKNSFTTTATKVYSYPED